MNEAIEKARACEFPNYEDTYRDIYVDNELRKTIDIETPHLFIY